MKKTNNVVPNCNFTENEGRFSDENYLWFHPVVFRCFAGVAAFVCFGMAFYGLPVKSTFVPFSLGIGATSLLLLVLHKFIPFELAFFLLLFVFSVIVAIRSAAIHSTLNAAFLCIILIAGSIMTSPMMTTVLFTIQMSYIVIAASIGIFAFSQKVDPATGLYYANTVTVLIPFMIISYVISMVVSRVSIGTIKKQVEQYSLLKKAQDRLLMQEKMASLRILTGGIAHELNNILTSILGNVNLIRLYPKDKEILAAGLVDVESAALRAKNLTGRLQMVSKGESPFKSISSLKETIIDTVNFTLHGSRSPAVFEIVTDLWPVDADIVQISQVVQNLVVNTEQAMSSGGIITVSVTNVHLDETGGIPLVKGDYVKICVKDQGKGIDREIVDKIYDPFFSTKKDGTGIGLTICYSIINNHHGHINVESVPGKGSEFCFYLPAHRGAFPEECSKQTGKKNKEGRALIVDDEEGVIKILERMLRIMGFEVDAAMSGEEAVGLFMKAREGVRSYLVVIIDLTIPGGMNGIETLKKMKEIDPDIKAVISSGYTEEIADVEPGHSGIDAVLPKPYTMGDLTSMLNELLKQRQENK